MTDTPKNQAPENFDHATKRKEYDLKRLRHTASCFTSTNPNQVPEGKIPDGGFQGA